MMACFQLSETMKPPEECTSLLGDANVLDRLLFITLGPWPCQACFTRATETSPISLRKAF